MRPRWRRSNKMAFSLGSAKKPEEKAKIETYSEYEDRLIEYLTSPSTINQHPADIEIEKFHQIICAINYPRLVDPGWLTRLIEMNIDFDLSIHINPYKIDTTIKLLESEVKKQKTDLYALEVEGKIVPQALIQQHQDTMALLQLIQEGTEKMFDMSLYLDAKGYTKEDLEKISKQIRDTMNSIMIIPKIPPTRCTRPFAARSPSASTRYTSRGTSPRARRPHASRSR
jgi:conjugal transfer ATP-binding protein TraC